MPGDDPEQLHFRQYWNVFYSMHVQCSGGPC